jgi:hypothetical protein
VYNLDLVRQLCMDVTSENGLLRSWTPHWNATNLPAPNLASHLPKRLLLQVSFKAPGIECPLMSYALACVCVTVRPAMRNAGDIADQRNADACERHTEKINLAEGPKTNRESTIAPGNGFDNLFICFCFPFSI